MGTNVTYTPTLLDATLSSSWLNPTQPLQNTQSGLLTLPTLSTANDATTNPALPSISTLPTATNTPTPVSMPNNPFAPPVDPTQTQATAGDLGAQQGQYYAGFLPSYAGMPVIQDQLAGKLSDSTINQLWQQGAERGVMSGAPASANANSAYMRALGLTTEQLQNQGLTNLNAAYKNAATLNPLGQSQQKLDSYLANLNQYGQTARQIMSSDTQIALQKLQASSNMDLEKQREAGQEALAQINNDATMSLQDKRLASDLVLEKLREANSLQIAQLNANTQYGVAELNAQSAADRAAAAAGAGTGAAGQTGTGSGYADLINSILARSGFGGGGAPGSATSTVPTTQTATGAPATGTTTMLDQATLTAAGLSQDAVSKAFANKYSTEDMNALVQDLTSGKYSAADKSFANDLLAAGYDPAEITSILGQSGQTATGTGTGTIGATGTYSWSSNPEGVTESQVNSMPDAEYNAWLQAFESSIGGMTPTGTTGTGNSMTSDTSYQLGGTTGGYTMPSWGTFVDFTQMTPDQLASWQSTMGGAGTTGAGTGGNIDLGTVDFGNMNDQQFSDWLDSLGDF